MYFPDIFVDHALPDDQYTSIGMNSSNIEKKIVDILKEKNNDYTEFKTITSE